MKRAALLIIGVIFLFSCPVQAAELAKGYVDAFGWGGIAASGKGYPPKAEFKADMFEFKDGKFFINVSDAQNLSIRAFVKEGKTLGELVEKVKKQAGKKIDTRNRDVSKVIFWASHNKDGEAIAKTWPTSLSQMPDWYSMEEKSFLCADEVNGWNSLGWKPENAEVEMKLWLKSVKPGWKLYVAFFSGFEREMPEARYFDEAVGGYKNPTEDVISEPIAAGTIEFK